MCDRVYNIFAPKLEKSCKQFLPKGVTICELNPLEVSILERSHESRENAVSQGQVSTEEALIEESNDAYIYADNSSIASDTLSECSDIDSDSKDSEDQS